MGDEILFIKLLWGLIREFEPVKELQTYQSVLLICQFFVLFPKSLEKSLYNGIYVQRTIPQKQFTINCRPIILENNL